MLVAGRRVVDPPPRTQEVDTGRETPAGRRGRPSPPTPSRRAPAPRLRSSLQQAPAGRPQGPREELDEWEGRFVPARRARRKSGRSASDRRRVFSPLAVTKRCIRYDPNVFTHRRAQILQMAEALNDSASRMLLVSGIQGAGKTSMVRGVIELMGGQIGAEPHGAAQIAASEVERFAAERPQVAARDMAHVLPKYPQSWHFPSSANPKRSYSLLNREERFDRITALDQRPDLRLVGPGQARICRNFLRLIPLAVTQKPAYERQHKQAHRSLGRLFPYRSAPERRFLITHQPRPCKQADQGKGGRLDPSGS